MIASGDLLMSLGLKLIKEYASCAMSLRLAAHLAKTCGKRPSAEHRLDFATIVFQRHRRDLLDPPLAAGDGLRGGSVLARESRLDFVLSAESRIPHMATLVPMVSRLPNLRGVQRASPRRQLRILVFRVLDTTSTLKFLRNRITKLMPLALTRVPIVRPRIPGRRWPPLPCTCRKRWQTVYEAYPRPGVELSSRHNSRQNSEMATPSTQMPRTGAPRSGQLPSRGVDRDDKSLSAELRQDGDGQPRQRVLIERDLPENNCVGRYLNIKFPLSCNRDVMSFNFIDFTDRVAMMRATMLARQRQRARSNLVAS